MKLLSLVVTILLWRKALSYANYGGIEPEKYVVTIMPYMMAPDKNIGTFEAFTKIHIYCNAHDVSEISFDSYDLNYTTVEMYVEDTEANVDFALVTLENTVVLQFAQSLEFNVDYVVEFEYIGKMGFDRGLKFDVFVNYENLTRQIVWTEGGPDDAMSIFPCFNDPSYRAKFIIRMRLLRKVEGHTNQAGYGIEILSDDLNHRDHLYKITPPIPAYMVTFVAMIRLMQVRHRNFRLISIDPWKHTSVAEEAFYYARRRYENIFGINYALLGIDHELAIAHYILYRNQYIQSWGVGLFEEELIVYAPLLDTLFDEENMKVKISAALALNWFANAISPKDWANSWLKRALAKYYEYMGTDEIYVEFQMEIRFVVEEMMPAMWLENNNFHLSYSSDEFFEKDDSDTTINSWLTAKSAAMIRMYCHAMSKRVFRNMTKNFILKYLHGTYTHVDYITTMLKHTASHEEAINIDKLYASWVFSIGVPLIYVSVAEDRMSVGFSRRIRTLFEEIDDHPAIAITYITDRSNSSDTFPKIYMDPNQVYVYVNFSSPIKWIIVNNLRVGFYRIRYTNEEYAILGNLLQNDYSRIHQINRAMLIDDLIFAYMAQLVTTDTLFSFLQYLTNETDYAPWKAALEGFSSISLSMKPRDMHLFQEYIWYVTSKIYSRLGMHPNASDTMLDRHLRNLIVSTNCRFEHDAINKLTYSLTWKWGSMDKNDIHPEMTEAVLCCGIRRVTNAVYENFLDLYSTQKLIKLRRRMFDALGCTISPLTLEKYVNLTATQIRVEERELIFNRILKENPSNAWFIYLLITRNIYKLEQMFGNKLKVVQILRNIGILLDANQYDHWIHFIKTYLGRFVEYTSILRNVEHVRGYRDDWKTAMYSYFTEYLSNKLYIPPPPPEPIIVVPVANESSDRYRVFGVMMWWSVLVVVAIPITPRRFLFFVLLCYFEFEYSLMEFRMSYL